jgi:hypothetical protein
MAVKRESFSPDKGRGPFASRDFACTREVSGYSRQRRSCLVPFAYDPPEVTGPRHGCSSNGNATVPV